MASVEVGFSLWIRYADTHNSRGGFLHLLLVVLRPNKVGDEALALYSVGFGHQATLDLDARAQPSLFTVAMYDLRTRRLGMPRLFERRR